MVDKFGNVLKAGDTVLYTPEPDSKLVEFEGVLQECVNGVRGYDSLYLDYPYTGYTNQYDYWQMSRYCIVFEDDGIPCYELTKIL